MNLEPQFLVVETMRTTLNYTGITGLKYIEINHAKPDRLDSYPALAFIPPHPVIPSHPGGLDEIEESLKTVYEKFVGLDTEIVTERATVFLETATSVFEVIDLFLRSPELSLRMSQLSRTTAQLDTLDLAGYGMGIEATLAELEEGSRSFNHLLTTLDGDLSSNRFGSRANSLLDEIGTLVLSGQQIARRTDYASTDLLANLNETLTQLSAAIEQMQAIVISMEAYPSNVLYTAPPRKE